MRVLELWRYPVKSMGGERLTEAMISETGLEFDRGWGLLDPQTSMVLTARRVPKLLTASACVEGDHPTITTEEGHVLRDDDDLSEWLDRPVELRSAAGQAGGTYENPLDAENDADWVAWQGPGDAWHDSARSRVSIVSEATLGGWDFRRFRANILVDGDGEDALVGRSLKLGTAELDVRKRIDRCVMVTRPQPGLPRDLGVLRKIAETRDSCLAVGATVGAPGRVAVGDDLTP